MGVFTEQPGGAASSSGIYGKYRQLLRDSPWRWVIIAASILYLLSPIDLIPDFIPVVGLVDDGVVACVLVHELVLMMVDAYDKRKQKKEGEASQSLLPGPKKSKVQGASMYPSTPYIGDPYGAAYPEAAPTYNGASLKDAVNLTS
ncbi:hypothetical protein GNI_104230 [Gregarina niphandrodes]|uniref:DUF1232 domain-containing protein n=1 Tax=Gregarina niphandrodes TaxID=110365 RepID=A0A023B473_GRENI|nr:hypothetical protein GNI_104230 [Gregarina niphandrodes]EZG56357.1 hypothetical protein GNI_104230 [Gregarina niphandrodes]|eukprot:XP_011131286.1 hypothetical protein GNI_104230 [Gregarina niphandrodes]